MNRKRFLTWTSLALLAVLLALAAQPTLAAPVFPEPVELTQPDGTTFVAQPFGDEWYSGYEHEGFTVLRNETDGYWYYAVKAGPGLLVPGEQRVTQGRPAGLIPHLRDALESGAASAVNNLPGSAIAGDASTRTASPGVWPGVSGSQPVLVILVDFTPSTSMGTTAAQWNSAFFDNTPGAKSVKNFYEEASFGQFTLSPVAETQGTPNDGIIAVTVGYGHIDTRNNTGTANRQLTQDALQAADAYIDYAAYDTNNNGSLDVTELHLIVIPRGFETAYGGTANACTPSVWGHRWSLLTFGSAAAPTLDGVRISAGSDGGGYMQFGEWQERISEGCDGSTGGGQMATIGIMAHELGHDINWPDLYDTDYSSAGVGYWSIMAGGSWGALSGEPGGSTPVLPDAYSKWYQGWITPTLVGGPTLNLAIPNAAQNAVAYQLVADPSGVDWDFGGSSGSGEFFLVENRQQVGFDAGLERQSVNADGCIIWHIDETVTSTNSNNNTESHKHVDVEEAHGVQDLDQNAATPDYAGHPWPGSSNNTLFDYNSTPNSRFYNGSDSNVVISGISTAGTGCTVNFYATAPDLVLPTPSMDVGQGQNQQLSHMLPIQNNGGADLIWSLWEDASLAPTAAVAIPSTLDSAGSVSSDNSLSLAASGEASEAILAPPPPAGTAVSLILDDDSSENSVGFTNGGTFMWLNRFSPAGGDFPFILEQVDVSIDYIAAGTAIDIWVYEDNDSDPSNGATFVGSWSNTVQQTGAWNSYTLASPPTLSGGGDVLIGVTAAHAAGQYPASLDQTISAGRSWYGSAPGAGGALNLLGTIDSASLAGNWMLRGYGTSASCDGPDDIGWLSLNPSNGTTTPGNQSDATVVLDSTGLSNGVYSANLCLDSNDPDTPTATIPVTMTVCAAPAALANVTISYALGDNTISWSGISSEYEVWWQLDDTYFQPGADCDGAANCAVANGSSVLHVNGSGHHSYLVLPRNACGGGTARALLSNRVARFDFALTPGQ